jgi:hypothetical protein
MNGHDDLPGKPRVLVAGEFAAPPLQSVGTARERILTAARPALYIAVILGVVLATYAYKLRTEGILACPADGYGPDRYLAYCQAAAYGDFEHGAFWFGLDPSIQNSVANAEVLFLGSSRMQIALSTAATRDWFSSGRVRYFLMGFGYTGNALFEG